MVSAEDNRVPQASDRGPQTRRLPHQLQHPKRVVSQSGGGKSKVKVPVGWFPLRILALACRGLALAASFQGLFFMHEPLCSPPCVSKFRPLIRTVVG